VNRGFLAMAADEREPVSVGQHAQVTCPLAGDAASVAMRADWIAFYDTEYHRVVRFVMKNGASLEDARDATEEAFVDSWALMTQQPGRWAQIRDRRSWIRAVALRKRQRPPGPRRRPLLADNAEIPDIAAPGPEPGELTVQTLAVLQALRGLDNQAQAVMAFLMDGFPAAVIAETLGITEQRVRDVAKRARATLKRILAQS
jgi:RNA polymerase sigma factor (sigma-70 family)